MSQSTRPAEGAATHTPGPLMRYGRMVDDTTETCGGMYCIARQIETPRGAKIGAGSALGYAYSKADADLWAAAPELLDALRDADYWLEHYAANDVRAQSVRSHIRAALRKAGAA